MVRSLKQSFGFLPLLLLAASCAFAPKVDVLLDPSLSSSAPEIRECWTAYGMVRATWMEEKFALAFPQERTYHPTFAEEMDARNSMLHAWRKLKQRVAATAPELYFDELVRIGTMGYLREYVIHFHRSDEWTDVPTSGLNMAEFKAWLKATLPEHKPQTLATARFRPAKYLL